MKTGSVNNFPVAVESRRRILRSAPQNQLLRGADNRTKAVQLCDERTMDIIFHPSVAVFFSGVALNRHDDGTTIELTGMGRNGFRGLLDLHEKGWDTIDQDERTSLRSGRPKAADTILALDRIGQTGMDQLAAKEGMSHG